MIILCEKEDCIYHMTKKNESPAYQKQCGNDEIEIGEMTGLDKPVCYSYEKFEE